MEFNSQLSGGKCGDSRLDPERTFTTGHMQYKGRIDSRSGPQVSVFLFQIADPLLGGCHDALSSILCDGQLIDPTFKAFDMILGSLTNCALGLPVVRAFSFQLDCREGVYTPGTCSRWSPPD